MRENLKIIFNGDREDKIILICFVVSIMILFFIILGDFNNIWVIIERAKKIFSFWLILFISIFLPRRILIRSKKFRYFVLKIRKKYPIVLYYRKRIFGIIEYINFFFVYIEFYLERILKYFLVGTKVKWLKPYKEKEVAEKGEFIIEIIKEIIDIIHYIILYVLKLIQEVIRFFDEVTIYEIIWLKKRIRLRILGIILLIIIGYIMGKILFFYYIGSILIVFLIYNSLIIYWEYKRRKKKKFDNEILNNILYCYGFSTELFIIDIKICRLRMNNLLFFKVLKFKKENFLLYALKRKYGIKEVTKYVLTMEGLTKVMLYENSYVLPLFISSDYIMDNQISTEQISKYRFVTKFYEKMKWYEQEEDDLWCLEGDSFIVLILKYENNFVNELEFQIFILRELIMYSEIRDKNYEELLSYDKIKNFFEFRIVVKFLKFIEKKIEEEGGYEKFKQKYYIDTGVWERMDSFLDKFAVTEEIEKKECALGLVIVIYRDVLISLNYNKNHEEEFNALMEKKYNKFIKK